MGLRVPTNRLTRASSLIPLLVQFVGSIRLKSIPARAPFGMTCRLRSESVGLSRCSPLARWSCRIFMVVLEAMTGLQRTAITRRLPPTKLCLTPLTRLRVLSGLRLVGSLIRTDVNRRLGLQLRITKLRMFSMLGQFTIARLTRLIRLLSGSLFSSGSRALTISF